MSAGRWHDGQNQRPLQENASRYKIAESLEGDITIEPDWLSEHVGVLPEDRVRIAPDVWAQLAGFIECREAIRATYQTFDGRVSEYELHPYHLIAYHGNWYVMAWNVNVHFQFAPGHAVFDPATLTARTAFKRGNLLVQALPQKGLVLEREQGQVSFAYGSKEPRPAFRFRLPKTADRPGLRFVTLLVPYEGADPPPVSIRQVGDRPPGASQLDLDVRVGSVNERVGYRLE